MAWTGSWNSNKTAFTGTYASGWQHLHRDLDAFVATIRFSTTVRSTGPTTIKLRSLYSGHRTSCRQQRLHATPCLTRGTCPPHPLDSALSG
jgi:hypothetical protein